jgi:Tol biopolymer transport system component
VKPVRGGLLLAVVAVLALLATAGPSSAAFPGANGLIAYSQLRDRLGTCNQNSVDNSEIFTISPAGGEPTRLTDNATGDGDPSWSADGRRLAFVRRSVNPCRADVWTMRADGTHQRQVTHSPASESAPSFSPGGGRIVMTRGWDLAGDVVIVRTDGTDPVRLTSGKQARDPVFSPNGRRIAFAGKPTKASEFGIWIMRRDGSHRRLLASNASGPDNEHPDFSPDGSHIIYWRCDYIGHTCDTDNIVMRADGTHKQDIRGGEVPAFSPDGTQVAGVQVSCDVFKDVCESWIISYGPNGHGAQVVTQDRGPRNWVGSPSWQPILGD